MTFQRTTAVNKLLTMKKKNKIVQGGTWGGKTHGIIPIISNKCIKGERLKATVVCETLPAVKEGPLDIFKTVMTETNRWQDACWNASTLTYTFAVSKSRIQFKSFDSVGKAKASGKRDILFLNEADNIPFEIADALMIRSDEVWMDFNPVNEFWAHTEVLPQDNSEFLKLTYLDNEACPPATVEDLEIKMAKAFYNPLGDWNDSKNVKSEYWANWCKVYIKGEIGSLQGVIFNNWKIIDNIPEDARLLGHGLDYGFTNDPAAIVDVYKYNDERILDLRLYGKGLSNRELANAINDKLPCYCDSAEPKSNKELKDYGVNAIGVTKGSDSIKFGIQIIQQHQYLITSRSIEMIRELRKYAWAKDKHTNEALNEPIDSFNHCMDAWRYHEMESLGLNKNKGKYNINQSRY